MVEEPLCTGTEVRSVVIGREVKRAAKRWIHNPREDKERGDRECGDQPRHRVTEQRSEVTAATHPKPDDASARDCHDGGNEQRPHRAGGQSGEPRISTHTAAPMTGPASGGATLFSFAVHPRTPTPINQVTSMKPKPTARAVIPGGPRGRSDGACRCAGRCRCAGASRRSSSGHNHFLHHAGLGST